MLLGLFEFVGRHGLKLTSETERCVEAALPSLRQWAQDSPDLWLQFRRILISPSCRRSLACHASAGRAGRVVSGISGS